MEPGSAVAVFGLGSVGLAVSPCPARILFILVNHTYTYTAQVCTWPLADSRSAAGAVTCDGHTLGCQVVQGAKMCGASKIIGVDLNPDKEEVGKSIDILSHFVTD